MARAPSARCSPGWQTAAPNSPGLSQTGTSVCPQSPTQQPLVLASYQHHRAAYGTVRSSAQRCVHHPWGITHIRPTRRWEQAALDVSQKERQGSSSLVEEKCHLLQ